MTETECLSVCAGMYLSVTDDFWSTVLYAQHGFQEDVVLYGWAPTNPVWWVHLKAWSEYAGERAEVVGRNSVAFTLRSGKSTGKRLVADYHYQSLSTEK